MGEIITAHLNVFFYVIDIHFNKKKKGKFRPTAGDEVQEGE
jgi:hypothetical protein